MKNIYCCILFFLCYVQFGDAKDRREALLPSSVDSVQVYNAPLCSESYILNSFATELLIKKGMYKMEAGEYAGAIACFEQALKLNPGSFEAYSLIGEAKVALEQQTEALVAFDKAIDLNPFYADAYFQRASLLHSIGEYKQAYSDYTTATYIDPVYIHPLKKIKNIK